MLFRRNGIRRSVQVNAVFAQAFAVVGHIQRTAPFQVLLQPGNELVEELVDIHNAVVISIDQLFVAATVEPLLSHVGVKRRSLSV